MNVEIGAEAALFPEKEYINGIAVAVWVGVFVSRLYEILEKKNLFCQPLTKKAGSGPGSISQR